MFPYLRLLLFAISSPIKFMAIERYTPSTSSERYLLVYRISRYTHISCHSDTCKFRFDPDCIQLSHIYLQIRFDPDCFQLSREHVIRYCDSIAALVTCFALQYNNWFSIRVSHTRCALHRLISFAVLIHVAVLL